MAEKAGFPATPLGKTSIPYLPRREQVRVRGNGFQLDTFRLNKDTGKKWFTNRILDEWNRLNRHVASANTIDTFK